LAETVVVTGSGKTVVIGSLMERNKNESVRKIPLLGDIPIPGMAFRRKIKEDTKTELLIFLTPFVVNQPGVTSETDLERNRPNRIDSQCASRRKAGQIPRQRRTDYRHQPPGFRRLTPP